MRAGRMLVAAGAMVLAVTAAAADVELAPSPALQCLTRGDRPLVYPAELYERREGGTLDVDLRFTHPDQGPTVKLLDDSQALAGLVDAVRKHVAQFRVPCLQPGSAPVVLRQQYVFTPNDGRKVVATEPRDEADAERRKTATCMRHISGERNPAYPSAALRDADSGNFLVKLRFTTPSSRPAVDYLAAAQPGPLKRSIETFVAGLRLPCMGTEPVELEVLFVYRLDGAARTVLKDMLLQTLLTNAEDLQRGVYFDLDAMACPFDVRFTSMRPYTTNTIQELDVSVPARRALLDWLQKLTLKLPPAQRLEVLGQTITVRVPCGKIDL